MNIIPLSDHVLEDVIMPFESYMFITTRRFIEKHDNIPSHTLSVFVRGQRNKFLLDDLSSRKEGLSFFNQNMKAVTGHLPVGTDVNCFILYLEAETSDEIDDENYIDAFEQLSSVVELFSKEEDSIVAMVPHFHQVGMMPHIHILHQRKTAEHDILQDYILEKLS